MEVLNVKEGRFEPATKNRCPACGGYGTDLAVEADNVCYLCGGAGEIWLAEWSNWTRPVMEDDSDYSREWTGVKEL